MKRASLNTSLERTAGAAAHLTNRWASKERAVNESTVMLGNKPAKLIRRPWKSGPRQPYRKTYDLMPGQLWIDVEETLDQWEHYVAMDDGRQIPVGALIAQDLIHEGAEVGAFSELWAGKCVLVDQNLLCISDNEVLTSVLDQIREANSGKLGGLPDVMAVHSDGRMWFREAKNVAAKDRLEPKQHALANLLRKIYQERVDLGVVEWGI